MLVFNINYWCKLNENGQKIDRKMSITFENLNRKSNDYSYYWPKIKFHVILFQTQFYPIYSQLELLYTSSWLYVQLHIRICALNVAILKNAAHNFLCLIYSKKFLPNLQKNVKFNINYNLYFQYLHSKIIIYIRRYRPLNFVDVKARSLKPVSRKFKLNISKYLTKLK